MDRSGKRCGSVAGYLHICLRRVSGYQVIQQYSAIKWPLSQEQRLL